MLFSDFVHRPDLHSSDSCFAHSRDEQGSGHPETDDSVFVEFSSKRSGVTAVTTTTDKLACPIRTVMENFAYLVGLFLQIDMVSQWMFI
ncbi:hypothetical protein ANCCAN_06920 [Ancylostoma caninum]|uniref:Uncharacterized protein n=1 Tax=Ancylostoma caninum TaxID=29170 RepID=A0A368GUU7_ANCCA|nr:hypothetical protein ANCCAN_06920 [Ancylostoma caninum]